MRKIFTDEVRARLKERVRIAEGKTTGEIVPLVVPRSMSLAPLRASLVLAGLLIGWACTFAENALSPFPVPFSWITATLSTGAVLGLVLAYVPAVLRLMVGAVRLSTRVHEAALAAFVQEGVSAIHDRSGVLIYVSLFEHRVEIVADRAIHEKVGSETWLKISDEIAAGFKLRTPVEALESAIDRVGGLLATHFPGDHADKNELSDDVRVRE